MAASREGPILIVDDSAEVREAIAAVLKTKGYAVTMAESVDEALQRLREGLAPCLILLDLLLTDKDGFVFRHEQVADPDLAAIPVVIYSGYHNVHYAALELGVVGYFQKPIDPDTLLKAIETYRFRG